MKLINADRVVHWQTYDDEHETYPEYTGTIAEFLDQMTDEGCPEGVDAVPVVRCRDCKYFDEWLVCPMNTKEKHDGTGFCSRGERKDGDNHEP